MANFLKANEPGVGEKFVNTETIRSIHAGAKEVWIEAFGGTYNVASDNPKDLAEGLAITIATADKHGSVLEVDDRGCVTERRSEHAHDVWVPGRTAKAA